MTRFLLLAYAGLLCLVAATLPAQSRVAGAQSFHEAFGPCGSTCIITFSPGGEISVFEAAALAVRAGAKRLVVIDGPCISACAIFADLARARVCITGRAKFGFHKASLIAVRVYGDGRERRRLLAREDPVHSPDIAGWVRRHGGFPVKGLRLMSAREASRFWPSCDLRAGRGG